MPPPSNDVSAPARFAFPRSLKIALFSAGILTALWLLSPTRSARAPEAGVVEINLLGSKGPATAELADAILAFEEESRQAHAEDPSKPIYRVISGQNASPGADGNDPTRFLLSVVGGMPPDVVYFDRFAVAEWAARDVFADLTPYIQRDIAQGVENPIRKEDYYAPTWNEVEYVDPQTGETGLYGIPDLFESRALVYNKDLLRRAGFVDESGELIEPRTWEHLEEIAETVTERSANGDIIRMGFSPLYGNAALYLYGWMNGGELLADGGRILRLDSAEFVESLQWIREVYDLVGGIGRAKAFESTFQKSELDPFLRGQVAAKIDGFWVLYTALAPYGDRINYGVAPPPMPANELAKGRSPTTWIGGWCWAMPETSQNKEAAWELIRFLSSPKGRRIMAESQRLKFVSQGQTYIPSQVAHIPINEEIMAKYVYDNPTIDQKLKDAVRVFNEIVPEGKHRPTTPVSLHLFKNSLDATDAALYGLATPKQALAAANAAAQRELNDFLAPPEGAKVDWSFFPWAYGGLIIAVAFLLYRFDTSTRTRRAAAFALSRVGLGRLISHEAVIEGAGGSRARGQWKSGFLCALPWMLGFLVFTGGPILFSIVISFTEYDILHPARWAGLQNYARTITEDSLFGTVVWNTVYMLLGVPIGLSLSLALALLLNQNVRAMPAWRTFFYLPSIVPAVASSILWIWLLNPQSGLINNVLEAFGIDGPNWLHDSNTSKISLILMGLWGAGGGIIIWLAGLKGINESYYEAARIDGANAWQQFVRITLPMLTPYIYFNLIMGVIGTLQIFTQAFIMTKGGPVNSTLFYVYHIFNHAFRYLNMGYASALAWILFIVVFSLTVLQLRLSKKWVHYEGE